jgi:hypothetical protein
MSMINVTYQGRSADFPLESETRLGDADIKRIAVEMIRSGGVPGMHVPDLAESAFDYYVVDRFDNQNRIYLRPKVPFGR